MRDEVCDLLAVLLKVLHKAGGERLGLSRVGGLIAPRLRGAERYALNAVNALRYAHTKGGIELRGRLIKLTTQDRVHHRAGSLERYALRST